MSKKTMGNCNRTQGGVERNVQRQKHRQDRHDRNRDLHESPKVTQTTRLTTDWLPSAEVRTPTLSQPLPIETGVLYRSLQDTRMQKDITSQESETKNQPMTPLQELNTSNSAENNQQVLQQLGEVKELLIKLQESVINLPDGLQKATSVQQSQWWESDFIKSLTECDILRGTRMTLENELKILTDYAKEAKSMLERNIATVQKGIELLQPHIIEVKRNFERLQSGIDDIKKKADESDHITITLWKEDIQALKQDIKSQGDREKMAALLLQVKEINDNISSLQQLSELLAMTMEQSSKSQSESDVDPTTLSESSNDFLKGEMRSLRENDIKGMHDDVKRVKSMLECNVCNQKGVESLLRELNEVKDLLLRQQRQGESSTQTGLQVWQQGIPHFECSQCLEYKKKLLQKDRELTRLASQVNAEMKKMQGEHQRVDCIHAFRSFFSNKVDSLVIESGISDKQGRRETNEKLCTVFQNVYDAVKKSIIAQVQRHLESLFEPDTLMGDESQECNDKIKAYGRFLSAGGLTGDCQIRIRHINKDLKLPELPASISREKFVQECIDLSWLLITNIPPMISSCSDKTFNQQRHSLLPGSDTPTTSTTMKYSSPILMNSSGKVLIAGSVKMTARKHRGTSIYDKSHAH